MKNITKLTMTITGVKHLFLFFSLFILGTCVNAQDETQQIKNTIERFFDGFTKGDTAIIFSAIDKSFTLQTVYEKNGKTQLHNEPLNDFIEAITRPKEEKWIENIVSYEVKIDGNLANAWCKYTFHVDTTFSHWGIDNFQLIKLNNSWKIFSIVDTRNKKETYQDDFQDINSSIELFLRDEKDLKKDIDQSLNNWHKAAATGNEQVFFGSMDSTCIYLGTDKTENWTKASFEKWSKKYFEKDKAWDFKPYNRHIYFSTDKKYAWFDELLETWMGISRGSGVLEYINGSYKLKHYNLAVTVPNEKMKEFVKINK